MPLNLHKSYCKIQLSFFGRDFDKASIQRIHPWIAICIKYYRSLPNLVVARG